MTLLLILALILAAGLFPAGLPGQGNVYRQLWSRWKTGGHSNHPLCRCGQCRYWKDEYRRG